MGVTGLWRLIEPAGKPVPVETLENKVLAVDISIWLHQMVKGYQDAKGAPLPNAHLMGLFQRLCKLLYFRVKPVFVFDGGFPDLKKETIAKRQDHKTKYNSESERIKRELALLLSKKTAIGSLLGKQISPKKGSTAGGSKLEADNDIFKLPDLPAREESESESEDEDSSSSSIIDLHSIDVESNNFKQLPVKEKYDLLIELKETRKMNSWGKLHTLPKKSDNFSDFQMQRLLKRRKVQECLEETEKEMGDGGMSLNELESLLNEEGIDTKIEALPTRRIASNNTTRFVLINNVKQALEDAKKKKLEAIKVSENTAKEIERTETKIDKTDELEDDLQKAIKMSLECVEVHGASASTSKDLDTSACTSKTDDSWTSNLSDSDHSHYDSEEADGFEQPDDMSSAKAYIMQYSDFTHTAIDEMVGSKNKGKKDKQKPQKVEKIIDELNKEKSIITDQVELSSDDDEGENESVFKVPMKVELYSSDEDPLDTDNIEVTQSSIMIIENTTQDIVSLDTSIDDNVEATQSLVKFIESPLQEIISLETSLDDNIDETSSIGNKIKEEIDSSESNDEFEDVPEKENPDIKTVVQLTLNMGTKPEDDIFADIFTSEKYKNSDIKINNNLKSAPDISHPNPLITKRLDVNVSSVKSIETNSMESEKCATNKNNKTNFKKLKEAHSSTSSTIQEVDKVNNVNVPILPDHEIVRKTKNAKDKTKMFVHGKDTANNENKDNISEDSRDFEVEHEQNSKVNIEPISKIIPPNDPNTEVPLPSPIISEKLISMVNEMENEEQDLLQEKGRLDRVGRNITEQMTKEAQELLQIFGIPYIVAPMEAEAQCAFLETAKLTDGTITDDSDIWLFGGKTVYKNFFNQKKHVLQFLSERIEKSFNLTREQLVLLALLVGSDYTTGLTGVGPVTALEILASFPFNKKKLINEPTKQGRYQEIVTGLQEFKKWVRSGKRTDNTTLKKKLKNVDVTDDFPSIRVVQAYLDPNIEKSEETFTWGELDITILRDYTKAKFGWSQNKLDEIIKPVIKRLEDRKNQKNIYDYFKKKGDFQSLEEHMSKRVKAAVQKMGPEDVLPQEDPYDVPITKKAARKRKPKDDVTSYTTDATTAGPSKSKQKKTNEDIVLNDLGVKVLSKVCDGKSTIEITIPKTDRVQEIIPQREKDKQSLLQNKMKAIEIFRKSKLDQKKKTTKRKVILPKEKAELSESDSD